MRLAMRLPRKSAPGQTADADPRDHESAEIIDLASRLAFPAVTQREPASDGLGLAIGVAIVGLIGAVTFWGMNAARTEQSSTATQSQPAPQAGAPAPVRVPQVPHGAPLALPQPAEEAGRNSSLRPAQSPAPSANFQTNPNSSPTVVFDASSYPSPVAEGASTASQGGPVTSGNTASDFASRIGGVGGAPAQAKEMVNPQTTITQGTLLPAVLETAINTDVPGYVRAIVSQDVRSFDGSQVLVPRSSRLIGQYQSGLQGGQKRAYVIWTRLIRPDGASINLASPAVSFDGTAGLPGKVNSHFFKRFGSSILLSVIGGLATGGASIVLGGGSSAASTALQQDGNVSPTVRIREGEPIRVFTARDLDFSQVSAVN